MRFVELGWTIFQSKFLRNRLQKNGLKNVYDGLSYGTALTNSILLFVMVYLPLNHYSTGSFAQLRRLCRLAGTPLTMTALSRAQNCQTIIILSIKSQT
jgi:hypothetical protein